MSLKDYRVKVNIRNEYINKQKVEYPLAPSVEDAIEQVSMWLDYTWSGTYTIINAKRC